MSKTEKPATQGVVVDGIDAHGAMGAATPAGGIDLSKLAKYPPFQMFIEEREPNEEGIDAVRYATERAQAQMGDANSQQVMLNNYLTWWREKGYWHGEDPMGGQPPRAEVAA